MIIKEIELKTNYKFGILKIRINLKDNKIVN